MFNWLKKLRTKISFSLMYLGDRPPWDSGITPPEVMEFLDTHPPGRALDLGCGTGTNVLTLKEHDWEVTGIDFVPKAIRQAKQKARRADADVNLIVGDVSNPAHYRGKYDLILDIGCYHALNQPQRSAYRENVSNHLAADGTYMLYGFLAEDFARLSEADISAFQNELKLIKRKDSDDPSGPRSTWLWFAPGS